MYQKWVPTISDPYFKRTTSMVNDKYKPTLGPQPSGLKNVSVVIDRFGGIELP